MFKKINRHNFCYIYLMALTVFIYSCKKSNTQDENIPVEETNYLQTPTTDRSLLTKDSIFLYAKQTYLWNVGMPSYDTFKPRQYSSNDKVVAAIRSLSVNGGKDKYSFIDNGSVAGQLAGVAGDFGFSVFFDDKDQLRIKYVYATSSAAEQGLKRGDLVTKINGISNLNTTDASVSYIVDAVFGSASSITLSISKPNNIEADVVINRKVYAINPVLYTNTYTVGSKKVGYIVYNSFTTNSVSLLDNAFSKFAKDGITELVVDLRYNGGGSVATAEAFTNLIAPAGQNGKVMYTTYWTQTMQDKKATILENQKFYAKGNDGITRLYSFFDYPYQPTRAAGNQEFFNKRGSVNGLSRIYFIVTSSTASASELLINNLKPVMDVKLIGKRTYGKPVGFFALRIDKSDLYIPQFQTKNQLNEGSYFDGMAVDKELFDDVTKDFGDPNESLLAQALNYAINGKFSISAKDNFISSTSGLTRERIQDLTQEMDHQFKGMVETRKLKFK